jgi:hypothetical protein
VAHAARRRLLSVHRAWLRWEDLEDCYSQATVELVAQASRGELRYASRAGLRGPARAAVVRSNLHQTRMPQ